MTGTGATETDAQRGGPVKVDRRVLEQLVCPMTRGPLVYDSERQELISKGANRAYRIHDGIPVMLVDEARVLGD